MLIDRPRCCGADVVEDRGWSNAATRVTGCVRPRSARGVQDTVSDLPSL